MNGFGSESSNQTGKIFGEAGWRPGCSKMTSTTVSAIPAFINLSDIFLGFCAFTSRCTYFLLMERSNKSLPILVNGSRESRGKVSNGRRCNKLFWPWNGHVCRRRLVWRHPRIAEREAAGLATNSIIFCWLFKIRDLCKTVRFQQTLIQDLRQMLLTVSLDLRAWRSTPDSVLVSL